MRKKPIKELISHKKLKVDPHYELNLGDIKEIYEYGNAFDIIGSAFRYGYLQGCKATKKKMSVKTD